MGKPKLVVVTGAPGTGTTTLAHELARLIPCPAVCRDEIKEGLVHRDPTYVPKPGDDEAYKALDTFFGATVARARVAARAEESPVRTSIHADPTQLMEQFEPVALPVPTIDVDTTDGYEPPLDRIVTFVAR
jgi:predicted kinase